VALHHRQDGRPRPRRPASNRSTAPFGDFSDPAACEAPVPQLVPDGLRPAPGRCIRHKSRSPSACSPPDVAEVKFALKILAAMARRYRPPS